MSASQIVTVLAAPTRNLTTLTRVKDELSISGSGDDAILTTLIEQASGMVEDITGRIFARQQYTETRRGHGTYEMVLTQRPIVSVDSMTYDGAAVAASQAILESPRGGIVWRENLWTASNTAKWAITYTAGYLTPNDDVLTDSDVSVDATDDAYDSSASLFSTFVVAGDVVRGSGWTNAVNNKRHVVTGTPTAATIETTSNLTTESGAASKYLHLSNLPAAIERVCIDLVKTGFNNRKRSGDVDSIKVGDVTINWTREQAAHIAAPLAAFSNF